MTDTFAHLEELSEVISPGTSFAAPAEGLVRSVVGGSLVAAFQESCNLVPTAHHGEDQRVNIRIPASLRALGWHMSERSERIDPLAADVGNAWTCELADSFREPHSQGPQSEVEYRSVLIDSVTAATVRSDIVDEFRPRAVRPLRRRVCYEERNAHQCPPAGGEPHRHRRGWRARRTLRRTQ